MKEEITIRGAREHNLKDVDLSIPRNKMIVFTGLSGSGKSSLAFDTIFAEGQRRYIESLSAYARQFLGKFGKPDIDEVEGLSPTISIDQKSHSSNPRSTVATITEIYDYLRVLFARVGTPYCPKCGHEVRGMGQDDMVDAVIDFAKKDKENNNILVLAPVVRGRKGEYYQMLYDFLNAGFREARIDGEMRSLRQRIDLEKNKKHTIELVVDRIPGTMDFSEKDNRLRLSEAIEAALRYGKGVITAVTNEETSLSSEFTCPNDGFAFPEIEPRLFSFNSPYGACEECDGLGVDTDTGAICDECEGKRLKDEGLSVLIEGKNISGVTALPIEAAKEFFDELKVEKDNKKIAEVPLREVRNRLQFLLNVGLTYLTLDRKAGTLSGGEAQRIRLASQVGSHLVGTLYILDEPTIGLHQRDNEMLVSTLTELRDIGNTVIVVEHDEGTIRASDYLVDFGPAAGRHGGEIVAQGKLPDILKDKKQKSLTLDYLRGEKEIPIPTRRGIKLKQHDTLKVRGATMHNLQHVNVDVPLRRFTAVTGVSGSGKSTLIIDTLYRNLAKKLGFGKKKERPGALKELKGVEYVDRVVNINQSPIGRTPRSNPATYVGAWGYIRDLFAATETARVRGYKKGRFSFNTPGGRCENCRGYGTLAIEMHFLPTVYVTCDTCHGKRFNRETLEVKYKGKNIYDVLQMTIEEAKGFFEDVAWLNDRFSVMEKVGLDYLRLGQPATTLSGGEAQRIKLSSELGKRSMRRTLYVFDEPTTGLHFEDVRKLIEVLQELVNAGNTVVVIEHNLEVIKSADWMIDLGPDGGDKGGEIIATGTPEEVARSSKSHTAKYLRPIVQNR